MLWWRLTSLDKLAPDRRTDVLSSCRSQRWRIKNIFFCFYCEARSVFEDLRLTSPQKDVIWYWFILIFDNREENKWLEDLAVGFTSKGCYLVLTLNSKGHLDSVDASWRSWFQALAHLHKNHHDNILQIKPTAHLFSLANEGWGRGGRGQPLTTQPPRSPRHQGRVPVKHPRAPSPSVSR